MLPVWPTAARFRTFFLRGQRVARAGGKIATVSWRAMQELYAQRRIRAIGVAISIPIG